MENFWFNERKRNCKFSLGHRLKALEDEFKKNGGEFREYKLGDKDLFRIEGTKSLDEGKLTFSSEGINFVGRVNENNGIKGKILQQSFEPNQSNTITATVIGNYKYVKFQEESYYCSQNINKLTPYFKINKDIALYLISHIQKFVSKYDGQQGGYKLEELTSHKILLPIKNEKIDFEYMEKFINILEEERLQILETYLQVNSLDNCQLTDAEQVALDKVTNKDIKFKEFYIDYQPWIILIYIAIFLGPVLAYLLAK